jgi:subtilase family serine protease
MRVEVDPDNLIQESLESNNVMTGTILVGTYGTYLPAVLQ